MKTIKVVYWSGTGNTQAMAQAIAEGVEKGEAKADLLDVDTIKADDLKDDSIFAMGCPAMGDEVLEEGSMEPFMEELESNLSGKQVALFGSYGWGDGQWMRDWEERVTEKGGKLVEGKGLMCCEEPDDQVLEDCLKLGEKLAKL